MLGLGQDSQRCVKFSVIPAERSSGEYGAFWASLKRGEYQAAQYKRFGKGGKVVWINASYNPIFDLNGKPFGPGLEPEPWAATNFSFSDRTKACASAEVLQPAVG